MRGIIQFRSWDPLTIVFQKMGPALTTALMIFVGIYFLYLANTSGLLWRESGVPCNFSNLVECRYGYLLNISWSLTMAILFPAIFFVVTKFYTKVPDAVLSVGDQALLDKVTDKINSKWVMGLYALLPILWICYFYSIIAVPTWTWHFSPPSCEGKENCSIIAEALKSISLLGVLTTLYHILNGLFIICLVRAVLIGKLITKEICATPEKFSFAHADGLYGLSKISGLLRDVYLIIALLTVYIVSYILDKTIIQDQWRNALLISIIYTSAWFLFMWLVQKNITEPLEQLMRSIKESELDKLREDIEEKSKKGEAYNNLWDTKERIENLPDKVVVFKFFKTLGTVPILTTVVSTIIVELVKQATKPLVH